MNNNNFPSREELLRELTRNDLYKPYKPPQQQQQDQKATEISVEQAIKETGDQINQDAFYFSKHHTRK
jgi:hypothetical protein